MIISKEIPKDSVGKLLEFVSEFREIARYKVNIKN